jgi:hypothetical protein
MNDVKGGDFATPVFLLHKKVDNPTLKHSRTKGKFFLNNSSIFLNYKIQWFTQSEFQMVEFHTFFPRCEYGT